MLDAGLDLLELDTETTASVEVAPRRKARPGVFERSAESFLYPEETVALSNAWREAGCEKSRNRLVTAHMSLARKHVAKMRRSNSNYDDMMQDAVLGLMRAAEKFEAERGYAFATYAAWWIRSALQDGLMRDNGVVRIKTSSKARNAFFQLAHIECRAETNLRAKGLTPTRADIYREASRLMGVSEEALETVRAAAPGAFSLNSQIKGSDVGDAADFQEMLVCPQPTAEEIVAEKSDMSYAADLLSELMSGLNEREEDILRRRAMSTEPMTLEELSQEYGVSRERIRQIEARALQRLREKLVARGIEDVSDLIAA